MHALPIPYTESTLPAALSAIAADSRNRTGGLPSVQFGGDTILNVVPNGNKPTTTTGWYAFADNGATITTASGGGIRLTARTKASHGVATTANPVKGKTYVVTFKVKTSSTTPVSVNLGINLLSGTGTSQTVASRTPSVSTALQTVSISWYADWTCAANCTVRLYAFNAPANVDIIIESVTMTCGVTSYAPTNAPWFLTHTAGVYKMGDLTAPFVPVGMNLNTYHDDMVTPSDFYNFAMWDWDTVFGDLHKLGFNCVRLFLCHFIFEDPTVPGVWLEEGFNWLNTVIARARNNGMGVILDMHGPHGGYQSAGYSGTFWTTPALQLQLKNLWVEIARRYKNENFVLSYDLINEPCAPTNAALSAYYADVSAAIFAVDPNHLVHWQTNFSGANDAWAFPVGMSRVVLDSHAYPHVYAESLIYEKTNEFTGMVYPETVKTIPAWDLLPTSPGYVYGKTSTAPEGITGWVRVSYDITLPSGTMYVSPAVATKSASNVLVDRVTVLENNVTLDDVVIEKTPSNPWDDNLWATTNSYGFSFQQKDPDLTFTGQWTGKAIQSGATGSKTSQSTGALNGKSCLVIKSTNGMYYGAECLPHLLSVDPAKSYRVEAVVYLTGTATLNDVVVGLKCRQAQYPEDAIIFNGDNIEAILDVGIDSTVATGLTGMRSLLNCPLNIGEYGVGVRMYQKGGAVQLLHDVLAFSITNNIGIQLFDMRGTYGLYYGVKTGTITDGFCLANTPMLTALEAELATV